jgi:hypothetical protein
MRFAGWDGSVWGVCWEIITPAARNSPHTDIVRIPGNFMIASVSVALA